jgi:hypothetical protein
VRDGAEHTPGFISDKANYFSRSDLTGIRKISPSGKSPRLKRDGLWFDRYRRALRYGASRQLGLRPQDADCASTQKKQAITAAAVL